MTEHPFSNPGEAKKLKEEIIDKASGIFQWVVLLIRIVKESDENGDTIKQIRDKIRATPNELIDLYGDILSKTYNRKKAVQLMQWICFAREPLTLKELRFAMVMDITKNFASLKECQSSDDFAENYEQMKIKVNSLSEGLVEIVGDPFR